MVVPSHAEAAAQREVRDEPTYPDGRHHSPECMCLSATRKGALPASLIQQKQSVADIPQYASLIHGKPSNACLAIARAGTLQKPHALLG